MVNRLVRYGRGVLLLGLVLLMAAASSGALNGLFRPAQVGQGVVSASSLRGGRDAVAQTQVGAGLDVQGVAAQDDNQDGDNDSSDNSDADNDSSDNSGTDNDDASISSLSASDNSDGDNDSSDNSDSDNDSSDNESTATTSAADSDPDIVIENVAPSGSSTSAAPAPAAASPTPTPPPSSNQPPADSDPDVVIENVS